MRLRSTDQFAVVRRKESPKKRSYKSSQEKMPNPGKGSKQQPALTGVQLFVYATITYVARVT
jgi:hypothetical protein